MSSHSTESTDTSLSPPVRPPVFLAPFSLDEFFARYWDQVPLLIRREDPDHFRDVVDLAELDRLVTSERLPVANFNLAQGDSPLPFDAYCTDASQIDKARALALHRKGATVILRSVEQWSPALNRLRIAAETLFRVEAQINVYLTPPSEKSTPPHWDTHDLLVLQIEGSKTWRLYKGARTFPLPDERFRIRQETVSSDYEEVVLHPGDTLYLPRGIIHEPIAETYSAHVSIGIHALRWYDLVDTALRLLAEREGSGLRQALPGWQRAAAPAPDPSMLAELLQPELLARAALLLRQRFEASRRVDLQGRLLETARGPQLDGTTRYRRRGGIAVRAVTTPTGIRLASGRQQVSVGPALKDAVDYIIAHESFSADELPGGRSSEERIALCVALHEIGVLKTEGTAAVGG